MKRFPVLVLMSVLLAMPSVDAEDGVDPYLIWSQGRPAEALPWLWNQAEAAPTWSRWYDAGLCAAAAGQPGEAAVAWLRAHRLSPWREEPLAALAHYEITVPATASRMIGPLARFADMPWVVVLISLAGASAGWLIIGHRGRRYAAIVAIVTTLAVGPALIARSLDARHQWLVITEPIQLLDTSGQPIRDLYSGTVLIQRPTPPSASSPTTRIPVHLPPDGPHGHLPPDGHLPIP